MSQEGLALSGQLFRLSRANIRFGLRVIATKGGRVGKRGEVCFVSLYTSDFRVRFEDGVVLRYTKPDNFSVLPQQ